jgi:hypothetical protein
MTAAMNTEIDVGNVNDIYSEWNVILISTCNPNERPELLQRMINSVAKAEVKLAGRVHLFLLLQQCSDELPADFADKAPKFVRPYCYAERISLSAARNRLLQRALAEPFLWKKVIVAFPDDDAWYPPGTLESIVRDFASDDHLGFWFCRYGSAPISIGKRDGASLRKASVIETIRRASSNTIFLRGDVARQVGQFDEALGVGTKNGSSEDIDVAIRAYTFASKTTFLDAAAIGHRDLNPGLRARYYRGSLVTLGKYAGVIKGVFKEFTRKLMIGCYLVLCGKLALREYLSAVRAAMADLGTAKMS